MPTQHKRPEIRWFKMMDKAFWLFWALLPVLFYQLWRTLNETDSLKAGLEADQVRCMDIMPNPANFSTLGTLFYNLPLLSALLFYIILVGSFHRMVHRFAQGAAFDSFTLRSMKILGWTLILYPFVDFAVGTLSASMLLYLGETKFNNGPVFVDIGLIAAGLFVIALMFVLKNAIDFKSENDLTI